MLCMFVLILPTPEGWKADRVDFRGKGAGHPNTCIQPSTMPGNQPGTSGLGGRDLYHCANPSAYMLIAIMDTILITYNQLLCGLVVQLA